MDPNACWEMICAYLNNPHPMNETERTGLIEATISLRSWLAGYGFLPIGAVQAGLNKDGASRVLRAIECYVKKLP